MAEITPEGTFLAQGGPVLFFGDDGEVKTLGELRSFNGEREDGKPIVAVPPEELS